MTASGPEQFRKRELDLKRLGEMLRGLRGDLSLAQVAATLGIPDYTLGRLEKGDIQNPIYEDMINLALFYGLTPSQFAALIDLVTIEETEPSRYEPEVQAALDRLRFFLDTADRQERFDIMALVDGMTHMYSFQRKAIRQREGNQPLPGWAARIRAPMFVSPPGGEREPDDDAEGVHLTVLPAMP